MKKISNIILTLTMMFAVSCMDMYNDVADEVGAEYNYFLAVTSNGDNEIRTFSLSDDGEPDFSSQKITYCGTSIPFYLAAHPTGQYLYVPDAANNTILMYEFDNTGNLTPLGIPNTVTTGTSPFAVKVHPSGKYVYVSSYNMITNSIAYSVNNDGTLTEKFTFFGHTTKIEINQAGTIIYLIAGSIPSGIIHCHRINADGSFTSLTACNLLADAVHNNTVTDLAIHPNSKHIYISRNTGFDKYDIKENGEIDLSSIKSYIIGNKGCITISPSGDYLYVAAQNIIYAYKILTNGELSILNQITFSSGVEASDILIHPKGKYLYVSDWGANYIYYAIINEDGTITLGPEQKLFSSAKALALIRKKK